jgi:hypothetical protein
MILRVLESKITTRRAIAKRELFIGGPQWPYLRSALRKLSFRADL